MSPYRSSVQAQDFHPDTREFFRDRKVVVSGGTGFIGSHVVEQLLTLGAKPIVPTRQAQPRFLKHLGANVEIRKCDLSDFAQTQAAFNGASVVMNLAASVAGLEYNAKHPASIFQSNLQTFFNSIRAASELNVARYLVTSTACVYPRFCSIPTPESEGFKDEPEPTNSGYGWAKRMEEYLGAQYAKEYGLSVAIARPYNAYGPRDNFDPKSSHVIPALILKAWRSEDGILPVWGDGSHSRSFLYVDDFARGLIEVAARYPEADALNIGANEEVTIAETATEIARIVSEIRGRKITARFDPQGLTGQPRRRCDTTKIENKLGYRAQVPFREGLRRTIHWVSENENHALSSHS
jgi:GDP-L-fucose synthase